MCAGERGTGSRETCPVQPWFEASDIAHRCRPGYMYPLWCITEYRTQSYAKNYCIMVWEVWLSNSIVLFYIKVFWRLINPSINWLQGYYCGLGTWEYNSDLQTVEKRRGVCMHTVRERFCGKPQVTTICKRYHSAICILTFYCQARTPQHWHRDYFRGRIFYHDIIQRYVYHCVWFERRSAQQHQH